MMTATPTQCPPAQRLQDYALGRLPDEDSEAVFGHLAGCEACASELDTIDDGEDSLIASLRKPDELADFNHEPDCKIAVSRALDALTGAGTATQLPQQIGEYEIVRPLGSGGMGSVYLARHTKLGREVALKVLATHRLADPRMRSRFESEMRAVGRLSHPNIVTAHDAREIEGTAVLVTEFIDGRDLGQLVDAGGPLSTSDACEIVRLVAVAMQYTHEQGFVHRDIKPSNIMLSRAGEVKLLDLGIARFQYGDPDRVEITGTGQAMGTADYIAPEQVTDSRSVDIRADIYALGCTLMKLLTGAAPFADARQQTPFAKMTAHVSTPPPRLSDFLPSVPKELASLVDSMLQKDPARRPQTPMDVAHKLTKLCTGHDLASLIVKLPAVPSDSQASSPSKPSQPQATLQLKGLKRRVPLAAAIASGFLGMMLGIAFGVIITIKYPDGTTAKLDVPAGSQIAIEHQAEASEKEQTANDVAGQKESQLLAEMIASGVDPLRFMILLDNDDLTEDQIAEAKQFGWIKDGKATTLQRLATKYGTWMELADGVSAPIEHVDNNVRYGLVPLSANKNIRWKDIDGHVLDSEIQAGGQGSENFDNLEFTLRLDFDAKLASQMQQLTASHLEKHLAIAINDKVVMSPRINAAISTSAAITGRLTKEELSLIQNAIHPLGTASKAAMEDQSSDVVSSPFRGIWEIPTTVLGVNVTELVAITERRFYVLDGAVLKDFGTISVTKKDGKPHIEFASMQSKNAQGEPLTWTGSYRSQPIGPQIIYQFIDANNAPDFLKSIAVRTAETPAGKIVVPLAFYTTFPNTDEDALIARAGGFLSTEQFSGIMQCMKLDQIPDEQILQSLKPQAAANAESQTQRSLKELGIAFHNFNSSYNKFPGSKNNVDGARDFNGATPYPFSWRIAILPFVDQQELYEQYRFDQPWDSEENSKLLVKMPDVFRSPNSPELTSKGHTHIMGFATESGALGTGTGQQMRDFTDGTSNTLLLIETSKSVPWTKPEDLTDTKVEGFTGMPLHYLLADGSPRMMNPIDAALLQKLITRDGGERIE